MKRISGPPYTPFSVHISLQTLGNGLSADVKAAEGFLVTMHLQVRNGMSLLGLNDIRLAPQGNIGKTGLVADCFADRLQLVVVCCHFYPAHQPGRHQVGCGYPKLGIIGTLDDNADIGCDQIELRETVIVHIIARLGGVLALAPVPSIRVIVVPSVVPGVSAVPLGLVAFSNLCFRQRCGHVIPVIKGVFLLES